MSRIQVILIVVDHLEAFWNWCFVFQWKQSLKKALIIGVQATKWQILLELKENRQVAGVYSKARWCHHWNAVSSHSQIHTPKLLIYRDDVLNSSWLGCWGKEAKAAQSTLSSYTATRQSEPRAALFSQGLLTNPPGVQAASMLTGNEAAQQINFYECHEI